MASVRKRLAHAWNAFVNRNAEDTDYRDFSSFGATYSSSRPDRIRPRFVNERTIISSVYTRIAIDAAAIALKHIRLDENERYSETIKSGLNNCLTVEANLDQAARHFRQDLVQTLCERGVLAIIPIETSVSPDDSGGYDIRNLRVGEIIAWYPDRIRVRAYNEKTGTKEELVLPKRVAAIVENPLYSVMNEPNSTLQRLIRKLALLDAVDEQSSSGKLDIIIQLPYVIKSEARREQAERRKKDIEMQLKGSQYGIAYTDGTERITQLNRPSENNMLAQVQYLTEMLYGQLGLTPAIFDGTASEKEMLNYHNRTIEPILAAITEAMSRTFLTKTARSQGQTIGAFREPFKLVAVADLAEIADKFTRNEILSTNEVRSFIGLTPSKDPSADELRNKNLPAPNEDKKAIEALKKEPPIELKQIKEGDLQNGSK